MSQDRFSVGASSLLVRREPWDCEQLGIEAAKVEALRFSAADEAGELLRQAVASAAGRYQHLATRVESTDRLSVAALQAAGFRLVDCVVHLKLALSPDLPAASGEGRRATSADAAAMGALSASAFSDPTSSFNRYLNDGGYSPAQVGRVYRAWGEASVAGTAADGAWVSYENDQLVGFVTFKRPREKGAARIPLNAVATSCRGRGVYRRLVLHTLQDLRLSGAVEVEITTQLQQVAVQRAWARLGAIVTGSSFSFHRWV